MNYSKYPLVWKKNNFSIKIFCSIPNIATGILVTAGKNLFVVDPGDGILRDLNNEIDSKRIISISDIFVTHGHHDHVGGVWALLTYMRVMNKKTTLTIHYPNLCVEIDSIYHAFNNVYAKSLPYEIKLNKIKVVKRYQTKGVIVKPFPVVHRELIGNTNSTRLVPALGFKFTFNGKKICYGGDTAYCEQLVKNAKNSDLAILEAGHSNDTPNDIHMSISEAEKIGKSAKEYFLVHIPE